MKRGNGEISQRFPAWMNGANWRTPRGPGSTMASLEQHPVVQVSQEDAKAYCA